MLDIFIMYNGVQQSIVQGLLHKDFCFCFSNRPVCPKKMCVSYNVAVPSYLSSSSFCFGPRSYYFHFQNGREALPVAGVSMLRNVPLQKAPAFFYVPIFRQRPCPQNVPSLFTYVCTHFSGHVQFETRDISFDIRTGRRKFVLVLCNRGYLTRLTQLHTSTSLLLLSTSLQTADSAKATQRPRLSDAVTLHQRCINDAST